MKSIQDWYLDYSESHQNKINKRIHYFCVPIIFFSIVGMLMSIPNTTVFTNLGLNSPVIANWAFPVLILVLLFYLRLSFTVFLKILVFSAICLYGNRYLGEVTPLLYTSIGLFVVAWIGQFIGHHIEGKKPSFLKDLQFLLIGPAWVFEKLF